RLGIEHGVDYSQTASSDPADAQGPACGKSDSCRLRHEGIIDAGVTTLYTAISR
ncbi:7-cyano-7-deazaguanine synthase, partial [Acinetobacter baumannii]